MIFMPPLQTLSASLTLAVSSSAPSQLPQPASSSQRQVHLVSAPPAHLLNSQCNQTMATLQQHSLLSALQPNLQHQHSSQFQTQAQPLSTKSHHHSSRQTQTVLSLPQSQAPTTLQHHQSSPSHSRRAPTLVSLQTQ